MVGIKHGDRRLQELRLYISVKNNRMFGFQIGSN